MTVTMGNLTPIMRMFDVERTKAFYIAFLGFELQWEHRYEPGMPLYMEVAHGDLKLHLSEHHGDCTPGSAVRIGIDDLAGYRQRLLATGYGYARPGIERMPWGSDEMKITDPSGNRLIFVQVVD